ncbi:hypothetical protein CI610_01938 [invertebrate metagenome]|uniref:Peptidase C14 caspase domain-containing protein n=1 Tax=invertebrate metagenome TaxID=1711999 RepID=A0A2H9T7A9_9ZZZZ
MRSAVVASFRKFTYFLFITLLLKLLPLQAIAETFQGAFIKKEQLKKSKIILVAQNYRESEQKILQGCITDMCSFRDVLLKKGFPEWCITELTDAEQPLTHDRITQCIKTLAQQSQTDKTIECVILGFWGHGKQVLDQSGDESDGLDEAYETSDKPITDDCLYSILKKFRNDMNIVVYADCCHARTITDMPTMLTFDSATQKVVKSVSKHREGDSIGAKVLTISACDDSEGAKEVSPWLLADPAEENVFLSKGIQDDISDRDSSMETSSYLSDSISPNCSNFSSVCGSPRERSIEPDMGLSLSSQEPLPKMGVMTSHVLALLKESQPLSIAGLLQGLCQNIPAGFCQTPCISLNFEVDESQLSLFD